MDKSGESKKRNNNEVSGFSIDSSCSKKPRRSSPSPPPTSDSPLVRLDISHSSSSTSDSEASSSSVPEDFDTNTAEDTTEENEDTTGENEDEETGEDEYDSADGCELAKGTVSDEALEDSGANTPEDITGESEDEEETDEDEDDSPDGYGFTEEAPVSDEAPKKEADCHPFLKNILGDEDEYLLKKESEEECFQSEDKDEALQSLFQDLDSREEYEHLFDGEEKYLYKGFCGEMICPSATDNCNLLDNEDASSPFVGKYHDVEEKFQIFLSDIERAGYGDGNSLRFRNDVNEIIVALSMEEIRDLDLKKAFWATGQHIDTYLHFRLSQFPSEIQQRVHRCSAYVLSLNILDLDEWTDTAPLRVLEKALDNEMKEVDFNIIPLLYRNHWTLAIVCGLRKDSMGTKELPGVPCYTPCVLHFNSLENAGIRNCQAYAISKAVAKKAQINLNHVQWYQISSPKQSNGMDCGFYVMRFVVEFLKNINSTQPEPVNELFHFLKDSLSFRNEGRVGKNITKVSNKHRMQLKGYIVSINKDERDWVNEVEELICQGRQCIVDNLPYCKPEEIIEMNKSETAFIVRMSNKVRPVYVPSEYVMQHWNDMYEAYIRRNYGGV